MARIRSALDAIAHSLGMSERLLARAQNRYKANRKRAFVAHNQQQRAREKAEKYDHYGPGENQAKGEALLKEAERHGHVAYKNHARAQFWLGRIKALTQRIHGLKVDQAKLEAELAKWRAEHGAHVDGNKVKGGTPKQRFLLECLTSVANASKGLRTAFYSMEGAWDILHELVGGPRHGHRSDCSSTVTGWVKGAGLPDINGTDFTSGWTETFLQQNNGWKIVSEAEMRRRGWGVIVYLHYRGDTTGHHTEAFTPSESSPDRTCGHGSAPVDFGVVDLFGDGLFACLVLDHE
jgi:hypothetical protein